MTNMNVYTDASPTQQTLFDEIRTYRRISTDFFLPSIIAHFVFVIGVWY